MTTLKRPRPELPDDSELAGAAVSPEKILELGERAVTDLDRDWSFRRQYTSEWRQSLIRAVASLRDRIGSSGSSQHGAAAEVRLLLQYPVLTDWYISTFDPDPSLKEIEASTWAGDLADSVSFFAGAAIGCVVAVLCFATLAFGVETPNRLFVIACAVTGGAVLAGSFALVGYGLYRIYVSYGSYWQDREERWRTGIERRTPPWKNIRWYVYGMASILLASAVALAYLVARGLVVTIGDYEPAIRLAAITAGAAGVVLFGLGTWPIVQRIVADGEVARRNGSSPKLIPPRIAVTVSPAIVSVVLLLINWLFVRRT